MQHNVRLESDPHAIIQQLPLSEGPAPDRVVIDDTRFLFTAQFKKSGPDLIQIGDAGKKLVLLDYFSLEKRPDLVSADGATMSADLVERLAEPDAPAQYAQSGAPAGARVIGRVELVSGSVSIQHVNGELNRILVAQPPVSGQHSNVQELVDAVVPADHPLTAAENESSMSGGREPAIADRAGGFHSHSGMA
jgi:hypothetical protein